MVTTVVVERRPRRDEAERKPQQVRARTAQAKQPKAATTTALSESERNQQISLGAYFRAEQRGFSPGHMWDDWLAAEREVDARSALQSARG